MLKIVYCILVLISSFAYQWLFYADPDYKVAFEHAYFTGTGMLSYFIICKITDKKVDSDQ